MKRFLCLSVFCALLGGCAGSASEFECNATTSDRCMTMEQANEMARKKTEGDTRGKQAAGGLPALVELPAPSVSPLETPVMTSVPAQSATTMPPSARISPTPRPLTTDAPSSSPLRTTL
ncbi:TPA: type IV conjugative transfer system lipoprotein TraV, partial [Aeromonas salmonicida]|nr:type IV conjugative transfer system lipoprotein TraV [Aeromonas salmonicida]HDO1291082.1 type IV conjugative transfer system lipoprotein TraV [Aeromonas salmonicida]